MKKDEGQGSLIFSLVKTFSLSDFFLGIYVNKELIF